MEAITISEIARRFDENPLIIPKSIKSGSDMTVKSLHNPGVFKFERKTWLLITVAESPKQTEGFVTVAIRRNGEIEKLKFDKSDPLLELADHKTVRYDGLDYPTSLSHLRLMSTEDGRQFVDAEHYDPIVGESEMEEFGIRDGRVTEMNGIYYLTYAMMSSCGVGIGLMQTRDWKRFERKGMILPPQNKDCAIFEEKIKDKYYALHSAGSNAAGNNHIWVSESSDSVHWGHHKRVAGTRAGMWDSASVGAGCSPVQTPHGWLAIYHGTDDDNRSSLGALLLDSRNPARAIARSETPLMGPTESYEINAMNGKVISSNGHLVIGDKIRLYYGAGDKVICGAELSIREIMNSLTPQRTNSL